MIMVHQVAHIGWLGWIIFAIVIGSLLGVVLAATLGRPWKPKIVLTFVGTLAALSVVVVLGTWLGGFAFGVFIP